MLNCSAALSSTISRRLRRGRGVFLDLGQRRADAFGRGRFVDEGKRAPCQRVLAIFVLRDDLDRNMSCQRIMFQLAQHGPAQHVRQEHVERYRRRLELFRQVEGFRAARRRQNLEAFVAGEIDQNLRIVRVVFDDQENSVSRFEIEPVVRQLLGDPLLGRGLQRGRRRVAGGGGRAGRHRRAGIFQRQIKREGAALAGGAVQMDFAAEQTCEFAADGQAEARAAIFSAGAASAC